MNNLVTKMKTELVNNKKDGQMEKLLTTNCMVYQMKLSSRFVYLSLKFPS